MVRKSIALVGLMMAPVALAEKAAHHPDCQNVVSACEKAGFKAGAHKAKGGKPGGEGLWIDCIQAVSKGTAVKGVTFTKEEADKCLAHKAEAKEAGATKEAPAAEQPKSAE